MPLMPLARRSAWHLQPTPLRSLWIAAIVILFCVSPHVAAAQAASFSGTVLTDSTERPLADAEITFPDIKRSTRSDSAGNFLIAGLKAGRYLVRIRRVGYVAIDTYFEFGEAQKLEADLVLQPLTTELSTVLVRDASTRLKTVRELEFAEHKRGPGKTLGPDLFEKEYGRQLSHILLARIAGIRTIKMGSSGEALANSRGPGGCPVQVILNGMIMYRPGLPLYDMNQINSLDVIGLKYYTYPETPERYSGRNAVCGTVVIWTK